MGAMTATMVGLGALQAGTQIAGGFMQKREAEHNASAIRSEAEYNAGVYKQQAGMIENQKQLKKMQDERMIRFAMGQTVATAASKGLQMSGSALAVLNDTMTQLEMDKAITQYNYDVEKTAVLSQAESVTRRGNTLAARYLREGDTAVFAGIAGGLTTLMGTAAYVSQRNFVPKTVNKKSINTTGKRGYGSRSSAYKTLGVI